MPKVKITKRSAVELLLNLGNYSNIKVIGDVTYEQEVPAEDALTTASFLQDLANRHALQQLEEQKRAIDELPIDLFHITK